MKTVASLVSIPPAERTVPEMLRRQGEKFGRKVLVGIDDFALSFRDAPDAAARSAGRLAQAGVGTGDRVAVICSNRKELVELFLGCGWLGAVIVPINTASRGAQLRHFLENSGARLLAVQAEFLSALDMVDLGSLPVETIWVIGGDAPQGLRIAAPIPEGGELVPAAQVKPGDTLAILYTSGTTGVSKGVCCPHAQFYWWGINSVALLDISEADILCTTLPLFHVNALGALLQALLSGATIVYEPRFSASGYFAMLVKHRATVGYLLGAMVPILLSRPPAPEERQHQVRIALAPGVPAQANTEFVKRTGIALLDGYGSTETNFVIGTSADRQAPGTMGPIFEGFEARVVDDDDNDVPDGEAGELVLRAAAPFAFATGYFKMPEKTVEAWRNLWFHSGDRVVREADGTFRFVDRLKDAIRRRGENISSFEVEQVLLSHPDVATAAVFPIRSELGEDEVMAAVVLRAGSKLSELDLVRHCEPQLAYFAVPRYVEFVDELPVTENGKVQKFKLRDRGVTPKTWDREASGYKLKR
jgi:carnitine-CoA ligase